MSATPTPLDTRWLHQQLTSALAAHPAPDAHIALPRSTVELMACVLERHTQPDQTSKAGRYHIDAAALRPAVLAELQRLAHDGEAPSKRRFDIQRRRDLPCAQHASYILKTPWMQLISEAGLRHNRWARRFAAADADDLPAEQPDEPPILDADDYDGYTVLHTRTEVITVGNIKTTRVYHALR